MSAKSTNIWMGVSLVLAFALGVSVSCKQRGAPDSQAKDVAAAAQTPILQLLAALNPVGTALAQPGGGGLVTKCEWVEGRNGDRMDSAMQNWANSKCRNGIFIPNWTPEYLKNLACCQSPQ